MKLPNNGQFTNNSYEPSTGPGFFHGPRLRPVTGSSQSSVRPRWHWVTTTDHLLPPSPSIISNIEFGRHTRLPVNCQLPRPVFSSWHHQVCIVGFTGNRNRIPCLFSIHLINTVHLFIILAGHIVTKCETVSSESQHVENSFRSGYLNRPWYRF